MAGEDSGDVLGGGGVQQCGVLREELAHGDRCVVHDVEGAGDVLVERGDDRGGGVVGMGEREGGVSTAQQGTLRARTRAAKDPSGA